MLISPFSTVTRAYRVTTYSWDSYARHFLDSLVNTAVPSFSATCYLAKSARVNKAPLLLQAINFAKGREKRAPSRLYCAH